MEEIKTVDLVIGVVCTFGLSWAIWVSSTVINLLRANNAQSIKELKEAFTGFEKRMTENIDRMNERQDKFMQTEIQELKSIARKGP